MGEAKRKALALSKEPIALDTFGGKVHVEWDSAAAVTPLGQLPFFIEFLKVSGLFDAFVKTCPLSYQSNNASSNAEVLCTLLLSILSGHQRYSHITAMRGDGIHPELLGVKKLVSEDAARRALAKIDVSDGITWLDEHLSRSTDPLLSTPWILDLDATIKCLYGKQEGAVVGYNPKKPGRPSHCYHSAMMANTRLALRVDVTAGNETAPSHALPKIWDWLDSLPIEQRPHLLRGDIAYGNQNVLLEAEKRHQPYLTKLKMSANVKALVKKCFTSTAWEKAGQGWEGVEQTLTLSGWNCERRVVVLRRKFRGDVVLTGKDKNQPEMAFMYETPSARYEYAVLVTSTPATKYPIATVAQLYRDRADAENNFDELKNQWGWGGFTTADLDRCQLMSRMVALVYNWWNLYVRLAAPHKHLEAITSRPLLLHAVASQTTHAGQKRIKITSTHAKQETIQVVLRKLAAFLSTLKSTAEQLTDTQRLALILKRAFAKFMQKAPLPPRQLALL